MSKDTFREDLLALLFHLRVSQLMISAVRTDDYTDDKTRTIRRLAKEVHMKMDWFVGVVGKILDDPSVVKELNSRDDKIINILNLIQFVTDFKGDLSNEFDFLTSMENRKDFFWQAWKKGWESSADHGTVRPQRIYDEFQEWYSKTFASNIQSLENKLTWKQQPQGQL